MALQVVNGAQLTCTFGAAPSKLVVLPANRVNCENQPAATIMDHAPNVNIMPFGMCQTPTNPQVAAATAAAMGVLTPQPCIPATAAPWVPGVPTVMIANFPVVDDSCKLLCMWTGQISVTQAGQTSVKVP